MSSIVLCRSKHPEDPERWCIFDGPHPGLPHADGLGSFLDSPAPSTPSADGAPAESNGHDSGPAASRGAAVGGGS